MMSFDAQTTTLELGEHLFSGSLEAEHMLLARGACGDLEALRILLDATLIAQHSNLVPNLLSGCEVLGRLTASHGEALDRRRLAGILALRAAEARTALEHDVAEAWEAEAIGILAELADEGYEEAADALNCFAEAFSPAAMADARSNCPKRLPACLMPDLSGCEQLEPDGANKGQPAARVSPTGIYFTKLWLAIGLLGRALVGKS